MILSKKEKEELVIKLLNEGRTTREIAQAVHISLRDIGLIAKKLRGDDSFQEGDSLVVENIKLKDKSYCAQSFQMFKENKPLVDVVIELDLTTDEVKDYHLKYLELTNRSELNNIYLELKEDFQLFLDLYKRIKKENLNGQDIFYLLKNQHKLKELEKSVTAGTELLARLRSDISQLEQEIREKENSLNR